MHHSCAIDKVVIKQQCQHGQQTAIRFAFVCRSWVLKERRRSEIDEHSKQNNIDACKPQIANPWTISKCTTFVVRLDSCFLSVCLFACLFWMLPGVEHLLRCCCCVVLSYCSCCRLFVCLFVCLFLSVVSFCFCCWWILLFILFFISVALWFAGSKSCTGKYGRQTNLASIGPGILSSVGVGVWGKAPEAFPDSNTTLDTCQSAMYACGVPGQTPPEKKKRERDI